MNTVARAVDEVLEATVVGSFSRIGPEVRGRVARWRPPPRLDGRVVLVTGATSGLGLATAVGVARSGAAVSLLARDAGRAAAAAATVRREAPGADVGVVVADLADLGQVRAAASSVAARYERVDVLVHNAGALARRYGTTADGTELTVATQLLAPFLLTGLLLPLLRAAEPSRVVQVSSGGMYTQRFDLGALEAGPEGYDGVATYARVKRAQLVLVHEWARRLGPPGVAVHGMHPGWADTPGIASGLPGFHRVMRPLLRTPEEGADTVVWLASAPDAVASTGRFWLDRRPRWEHKVPWTRLGHEAFVRAGSALWAWCAARVGWDGLAPARWAPGPG